MIHFVGAGPGAPDLITLRGAELLKRADVVIYAGSLVNPVLLGLCREDCRGLCPHCGKDLNEGLCGCRSAEPEDPVDARLAALKQLLD